MKSTDYFADFAGNEQIKQKLSTLLDSRDFPPSVLLCGEEGCGRGYFSRLLASAWLSDENGLVRRGVHPDLLYLDGKGASGQIPVSDVRDVVFESNKSAVTADGRRIVLINKAENLNRSSAAALLKAMEEPSDGVIFVMTAVDKKHIIDTLVSRCAVFFVMPLSPEECVSEIMKRGYKIPKVLISELSMVFRGKLGIVLKILDDSELLDLYLQSKELAASLEKSDRTGVMSVIDRLEGRKQLESVFFYCEFVLGQNHREGKTSAYKAGKISKNLIRYRADIKRNINIKLLSASLALSV